MDEDLVSVLKTIPSNTAGQGQRQGQRQVQRGRSSTLGGIMKLASIFLNADANSSGGGGGGGYDGGGGVDFTQPNMDFTQGLQNQTWDSVNSAAANWDVQ
jgi:hypothetical protein